MKKIQIQFLCLTLFLISNSALIGQASKNVYDEREKDGKWDLDISFGYGANHGGLGVKATLSDILTIGVGSFKGYTLYEVGLQYPFRISEINQDDRMYSTSYFNISYGGIGVKTESTYSTFNGFNEETSVINGWNILVGYLWVFGNEGKIFIDSGIGYAFGKETYFKGTGFEQEIELKFFTIDLGIGYRFF